MPLKPRALMSSKPLRGRDIVAERPLLASESGSQKLSQLVRTASISSGQPVNLNPSKENRWLSQARWKASREEAEAQIAPTAAAPAR